MKFLHFPIACIGLLASHAAVSQNVEYVKTIIDSLCAPAYHGRGYVDQGDVKAAKFIERQLDEIGTEQPVEMLGFTLGVNTFPGKMDVNVNGKALIPGADYIIDPKSSGCNGTYDVVNFKPKWAGDQKKMFDLTSTAAFKGQFVVFKENVDNADYQTLLSNIDKNPFKAAGYIIITDKKLTWSVSRSMIDCVILRVDANKVPKKIKSITAQVDQHFESKYQATNVMATLSGTSDSSMKSLVFTAHLDHLGHMGAATYIPGANDNASGSAMLLDLYQYYYTNRPERDVVFIWFGAEEAGLVGSRHFVENSPLPLSEIQFLINLDLMGDAKTGITVVNGKVYDDHFGKLSSINIEQGLLETVKARGPAANSDHHPFYEKGVPCFFIYTTGDYTHYHDIDDKPENLPMTNYGKVFKLIDEFAQFGI